MRALLGWILAVVLVASPAMAGTDGPNDDAVANDSGRATVKNTSATPPAAAASPLKGVSLKPAASSIESELEELRDLLESQSKHCLLYTSPSPRDRQKSRMPS